MFESVMDKLGLKFFLLEIEMNEFTARIKRFVFEFSGEKNLKTAQNRENLDKELLNDSLMKNTFSRNYLLN